MKSKIIAIIKNKYFIAFAVVFVWLLFFERHNLIRQWRTARDIHELKKDKTFYKDEIYKDSLALDKIKSNPDALEKLAREKYFMKKEDEDIFIIEE